MYDSALKAAVKIKNDVSKNNGDGYFIQTIKTARRRLKPKSPREPSDSPTGFIFCELALAVPINFLPLLKFSFFYGILIV